MDHTTVGKGARLRRAIVDRFNIIPGGHRNRVDPAQTGGRLPRRGPPGSSWCRAGAGASSCGASTTFDARGRHPRPLLPAAPREPLARGGRDPRLGGAAPRLERAGDRRVLRAQTPPRGAWTTRTASSTSSTTSRRSRSTWARRSSPGSSVTGRTSARRSSRPTAASVRAHGGHGNATPRSTTT